MGKFSTLIWRLTFAVAQTLMTFGLLSWGMFKHICRWCVEKLFHWLRSKTESLVGELH